MGWQLPTTVLAREEVDVKQKRIFDINYNYGNYVVGYRAESNPVFVRWFGQSTNQLR